MRNIRYQRLQLGLFLLRLVPILLHGVIKPFQPVADTGQQGFRLIIDMRPLIAAHHSIQCLAQTVGEKGQLELKVFQKNSTPHKEDGC